MKILVMIKQVPDTATQVKIGSDPKAIDTAGITWIVSPYDEFALEEGLRIKESAGRAKWSRCLSAPTGRRRRCAPAWPWARTAPSTSSIRCGTTRTPS